MVKFSKWDVTEHLKTEKDIQLYLKAAFDDGDPDLIAAVLGDIAKIRGMSKIAKKAGVNRVSLYRSLSKDTRPHYDTISKVMGSLGYRLTFEPWRKVG